MTFMKTFLENGKLLMLSNYPFPACFQLQFIIQLNLQMLFVFFDIFGAKEPGNGLSVQRFKRPKMFHILMSFLNYTNDIKHIVDSLSHTSYLSYRTFLALSAATLSDSHIRIVLQDDVPVLVEVKQRNGREFLR